MTPQEREELFTQLQKEERELLSSKGADYSGKTDCLANFKINAERLGMTKYQILLIYLMKHIDSILNAVKGSPEAPMTYSESIHSRVLDARNYLGLLECLLVEDITHTDPVKAAILGAKPGCVIPVDCIKCYPCPNDAVPPTIICLCRCHSKAGSVNVQNLHYCKRPNDRELVHSVCHCYAVGPQHCVCAHHST